MSRKNCSEVWDYFEKVENAGKAVCKTCKESYSYKSTVANLKNHLKRKHFNIYMSLPSEVQKLESEPSVGESTPAATVSNNVSVPITTSTSQGTSLVSDKNTCSTEHLAKRKRQNVIDAYVPKKISKSQKELIDRDVLELCIDSFQPFSIVEERSFRKLIKWIPGYQLPSRKTLSNTNLTSLYNSTKEKIIPEIEADCETMCVTLDLWTSRKTESYISITGHYINRQFQLKTVLLDCCSFPGNSTSLNLASELRRITNEWNLTHKINFAVTDNGANVVKAVKELLHWKHFGCYAHTLNLILQDSLKEFKDSLAKIKKIVGFFHKSSSASEKFLKQQVLNGKTPKKLVQEVETRWNSTFFMLERAVELKEEIKMTMAVLNNNFPLISEEEWSVFGELCRILKPFEEMTASMSGEKYVTGSNVIVVTRILQHSLEHCVVEESDYMDSIKRFMCTLKNNFKTRLGNVEKSGTFSLCTFLDPRYKMGAFTDSSEAETTKQRVLGHVQEMIARKQQPPPALSSSVPQSSGSAWNIFDTFMATENRQQGTPLSKAIKEVQMYIDDDILPRIDEEGNFTNPQAWWYEHRHLYPHLAEIYRTNCNVVATSVPCERMFSKTGQIISDRRASLKTEKVRQLMFLNVNLDPARFS